MSCPCQQRFEGVRLAIGMRSITLRGGLAELGSGSSRVEVARREYLQRELDACAEAVALIDAAQESKVKEPAT